MPDDVLKTWDSSFGAALFNLYTLERRESESFLFSQRANIVREMIVAMLDAEQKVHRMDNR